MQTNDIFLILSLVFSLILLLRVLSLQRQVNEIRSDMESLQSHSHANTSYSSSTHSFSGEPLVAMPDTMNDRDALEQNVLSLIQQGKKINAIKKVREATGMGLKEAKDYVDRLENQYRQRSL